MNAAKCAISAAAAFTCVIAVATAGAATDPRTCPAGSDITCSRTAAVVALKQYVAAKSGLKVWRLGTPACMSPGGSGLVWKCAFTAGHATISFREATAGWSSTVWVTCSTGAVKTGCR